MTVIAVDVPGVPQPQGSKKHVGKGILVDDNADRLKPWRATVTAAVRAGIPDGWQRSGAKFVTVTFTFPRPLSHYTSKGQLRPTAPQFKATRPDVDKCLRAIADACTDARVWNDDGQVAWLLGWKVYGEQPGAAIEIGDGNG